MFLKGLSVLLLALLAVPGLLSAQILDDSTRQVYGTLTTREFTEADLLHGRYEFPNPDTTIYNFHNERRWLSDTAYYQYLDNFGSAAQPFFWQMPRQLGARPGKHAFDLYAYHPAQIRYFDTRSPFSAINYINGARGNQFIEVNYARNIKPWWNIGFDYRRLAADRQIAYTNRQDETQITSNAFALKTSLRSTNDRYRLLAHMTTSNLETIENGGVLLTAQQFADTTLDFRTEQSRLTSASNRDKRFGLHLYHHYQLVGESLKLYHSVDHIMQANRYRDDNLSFDDSLGNYDFYPGFFEPSQQYNTEYHRTTYRHLENVFGVRGSRNHIGYRAYIRRRDVEATGWRPEMQKFAQHFAGGEARLTPIDSLHAIGFAEKQLDGEDYKATVQLRYRWFTVAQERVHIQPTLTEQSYYSRLFTWDNNFRNSTFDQTRATLQFRVPQVRFGVFLEAKYLRYSNLVYFDQNAQAAQSTAAGNLMQYTVGTYNGIGSFRLRNRLTYSQESAPELLRMPELFLNTQLYFEGAIFKKALVGQIGFEGRYWSGYFPDAYMPATQQFYLQNEMQSQPYPLVDFFINADIKTVSVFLKLNNITYGLLDHNYFLTPYYPGFGRSFAFGFRWLFFD